MKNFILPLIGAAALTLASCGDKNRQSDRLPDGFDRIGDIGRVDYMMKHATPDSVARFIVDGALGRIPGVRIDTMAIATSYAYDTYKGDDLDNFSVAYDQYINALSLPDRMKAIKLGGSEAPQRLGYVLGLDYMNSIRQGNKTIADVDREISEFRKACGSDTATYNRFMIGFRTVLRMDHGVDVPEDIYKKYAQ